eukprot:1398724-Rhodomonas_salina.1
MKASCCRIVIFSRLIRSSSDSAELRTAFSVFWRRKGKYTIRYFQTSSGIQWTSALEKGQKQGIGRRKRDGVEVIGFAGRGRDENTGEVMILTGTAATVTRVL